MPPRSHYLKNKKFIAFKWLYLFDGEIPNDFSMQGRTFMFADRSNWKKTLAGFNVLLFPVIMAFALPVSSEPQTLADKYKEALYKLCDAMIVSQVKTAGQNNYGALVCPSVNPDNNAVHSRGAEAAYPLAVAFKRSGKNEYLRACKILGDWLVKIQNGDGSWDEEYPTISWRGTTTDQLVGLSAAYLLIKDSLTVSQKSAWQSSISKAAEYCMGSGASNLNYVATKGVALWFASNAMNSPNQGWKSKAEELLATTVNAANADGLLSGEDGGVDIGYNIAQTIGYVALYGKLTEQTKYIDVAVKLLTAHSKFIYPNGSVDNSWGTRGFKWMYESGTKTAPGVHFTLALVADKSDAFASAAGLCIDYLNKKCIQNGLLIYGPHAPRHASCTPPCNYLNFCRAHSVALALEYGANLASTLSAPVATARSTYFPTVKVAVVRTRDIMATVTASGAGSSANPRGGSICNLWWKDFGDNGYMQTSSQTTYDRKEGMHMPTEQDLLPLTPRIELAGGFSNLYEKDAKIEVTTIGDAVTIVTSGQLKNSGGQSSNSNYTITNSFRDSEVRKTFTLNGVAGKTVRIVEPFVNDSGTTFTSANDSSVTIAPAKGGKWIVEIVKSDVPYTIKLGVDAAKYWCPFPSVECYPVSIEVAPGAAQSGTIVLAIRNTEPPLALSREAEKAGQTNVFVRAELHAKALKVTYKVPVDGIVRLVAYTAQGRKVAEIVDTNQAAGLHTVTWRNPAAIGNDAYVVRLTVSGGNRLWEASTVTVTSH
jgi:hypothetical protein